MIYNIPTINGYPRGKTEGCYVDTNNVYMISRMNGYHIVLIDGYERPRNKMPWDSIKLPWYR
jgi:hypothetical protein